MVFDIEQHRADKMKFPETLCIKEREFVEQKPGRSRDGLRLPVAEVGKLAGLDEQHAKRIASDLEAEGSVCRTNPLTGTGSVWLTKEGRQDAEKHLYEKSSLGKRRKAATLASNALQEVGKSIWTNAASGIGGLIAGWVMGYNWNDLIQWLRSILGH